MIAVLTKTLRNGAASWLMVVFISKLPRVLHLQHGFKPQFVDFLYISNLLHSQGIKVYYNQYALVRSKHLKPNTFLTSITYIYTYIYICKYIYIVNCKYIYIHINACQKKKQSKFSGIISHGIYVFPSLPSSHPTQPSESSKVKAPRSPFVNKDRRPAAMVPWENFPSKKVE